MNLFSYNVADKRRTLAARTKSRAQHVVRAVKKHFRLKEEWSTPAQAVDKSSPPSTPRDPLRLPKRCSIQPARPDFELALRHLCPRRAASASVIKATRFRSLFWGLEPQEQDSSLVAPWSGLMKTECMQCGSFSDRKAPAGQETEGRARGNPT